MARRRVLWLFAAAFALSAVSGLGLTGRGIYNGHYRELITCRFTNTNVAAAITSSS